MEKSTTSTESMFKGTASQIISVLICSLSAIADGMQYAWTSPVVPILTGPNSPLYMTEPQGIWLENVYLIGGVCGLPLTMWLVDGIGRKYTMISATSISLIGWILIAAAYRIEFLYVGRFLIGMASDVAYVSVPMYIAEIADKKIRGFLEGTTIVLMMSGTLLIYIIVPYVSISISTLIGCGVLCFQLLIFPFVPCSPYYLLSKGMYEPAKEALIYLRGTEEIDDELQSIVKAVEIQNLERSKPQDLLLVKSNRKAMIILAVLESSQHFSSFTVMMMNLYTILEASKSVYLQPQESAICFATVMLLASTISGFLLDKFGRRVLLIISSISSTLILFALAIYFTLQKSGYDVTSISWLPIAAVMAYAAAFKFGMGVVPLVITAELFPTNIKAIGMSIADAIYLASAVISLEVYQLLKDYFGQDIPFYVFGIWCVGTMVFTLCYIPETKGKTLEEIQFMLKGEQNVNTKVK